jgi:hypothetical protein
MLEAAHLAESVLVHLDDAFAVFIGNGSCLRTTHYYIIKNISISLNQLLKSLITSMIFALQIGQSCFLFYISVAHE